MTSQTCFRLLGHSFPFLQWPFPKSLQTWTPPGSVVARFTFWPFSEDGKIIGEDIYSSTTELQEAVEVNLNPYIFGESI